MFGSLLFYFPFLKKFRFKNLKKLSKKFFTFDLKKKLKIFKLAQMHNFLNFLCWTFFQFLNILN